MKGRRLFLILAISIAAFPTPPTSPWVYIDTESDRNTQQGDSAALNGHVVWLHDPASDLCLGADGFSQCGDTNLFRVASSSSSPRSLVQFELIEPPYSRESRGEICLGRSRLWGTLSMERCAGGAGVWSSTHWDYGIIEGRLASGSGRSCVHQQQGRGALQSCSAGFTELRPVIHTLKPAEPDAAGAAAKAVRRGDSWVCPHTGLTLPSALLLKSKSSPPSSQQLLAGGVYTKLAFGITFKVFSLAWFVDKRAAAEDASLAPFRDLAPEERAASREFFDALASPAARYDRSVLVKMAMTVKRDMLIDGLVRDLDMRPENARLIADAGRLFKSASCDRGTELLFTWRAAAVRGGGGAAGVEIRVNGKLTSTLSQPGLGEDFFSKFVMAHDPVSPSLRQQLGEAFDVFTAAPSASASIPETPAVGVGAAIEVSHAFLAPASLSPAECRSLQGVVRCLRRIHEKRPALLSEMYASLFVIFYCVMLITQSLPSKSRQLFRVVRLREKLSTLQSKLQLSAEHFATSAEHFAKKCSIHNALNLITSDSVGCPSLAGR